MNYMMFVSLAATNMTFGERAAYAGRMLLIGMLMVFSVLTLLWGVLIISKMLFAEKTRKSTEMPKAQKPAPKAEVAPPAAPVAPVAAANDAAIVAAITAAIAAARADEGCVGGFRVVSFRRAENGRAWNRK